MPHNRHYKVSLDGHATETEIFPGFLYGYGVFTTFLAVPNVPVFRLQAHYERLRDNSAFLNLRFPWESFCAFEGFISAFMLQEIEATQVVRFSVLSAENYSQPRDVPLESVLYLSLRSSSSEFYSIEACTLQFDRLFPHIKHMSHVAEGVYFRDAHQRGVSEFIRLNSQGHLAEASYANLFLVSQTDTLLTPHPQAAGCLPGIMRQAVLDTCKSLSIPVEEGLYLLKTLAEAKGVFLTNAVRGVYPVNRVDANVYDVSAIAPLLEALRKHLPLHSTT